MELYWNIKNDAETIENAVENGEYDYIFIAVSLDSLATGALEFYLEEEADE